MRYLYLFLMLAFLCAPVSTFGQGKLEKAEESISKRKSRSSNVSYSRNDHDYYDDSSGNLLVDIFGGIFVEVFWATTYGLLIETQVERDHQASQASLTKYPYLNGQKGNFSYDQGDNTSFFKATLSNRYVSENANLNGNQLTAELWFAKRISLETDYLQLWEDSPNFGKNSLATYQFLAKYHRVRTERFNLWWGIGTTYVDGAVDQAGFTYGIGSEWFFTNPMSLQADFTQTLINQNTVNSFTGLLNYHTGRFKVSAGYEHLKIGDVEFNLFSAGIGISL